MPSINTKEYQKFTHDDLNKVSIRVLMTDIPVDAGPVRRSRNTNEFVKFARDSQGRIVIRMALSI